MTRRAALTVALAVTLAGVAGAVETEPIDPFQAARKDVTQGALRIVGEDGSVVECPLKHTDVEAEVSGFIARVTVTQTFQNPLQETIEAIYVFPLPHEAAVDDMTMVLGDRRIVGRIERRAQARAIYEAALRQGATAALLEQERPNIFTQSVGNIDPGETIRIEISYVDVLAYDLGTYTFRFPMVVGPRYMPGAPTSTVPPVPEELQGKVGELDKTEVKEGPDAPKGTGWSPDTTAVPDASRISPPVLKPDMRNGHDISLSLWVDAGVAIQNLESPNHEVRLTRQGPSRASVEIAKSDTLPNKDFVLKYAVVGAKPEMAVLTHTDPSGSGYLMLMVQPKEDERLRKSPPREVSFLIDVSGSMSGQPTAKVIEAMKGMLKLARPIDTVQVITFSGRAQKLFETPVACTPANIDKALAFTEGLKGGGGTEMLKGIKAAFGDPLDPDRVRIVVMLTDGYIGNEAQIIEEVGRRCGDRIRFWCIGIGQAPNMHLVDGVAKQGGGMGKVLGLNEEAGPLTTEIMYRIQRAQLAEVAINWGTLGVHGTYPARIPELWAGRPIIVYGMYEPGGGTDTIRITGKAEGEPVAWTVPVTLPARQEQHDVLAKVWARQKIESLMHQTYYAGSPAVEEAVTSIALEYRLMSQYTSFVAVDESELGKMTPPARPPRRMLVPVPIPEGTRYEGFFGGEDGRSGEAKDALALGLPALGRAFGGMAPPMARTSASRPASLRRYRADKDGQAGQMGGWFGWAGCADTTVASGPTPDAGWGYHGGNRAPMAGAKAPRTAGLAYHYGGDLFTMDDYFSLGDLGEALGAGYAFAYWGQAVSGEKAEAEARRKQADVLLEAAAKAAEAGRLDEARAAYGAAYLFASAGHRPDVADKAMEGFGKADAALRDRWTKARPDLETTLDVELRGTTLEAALATIADAAGLRADLLVGSAADARELLQGEDPTRLAYLDLRGATVAQGLDWLLHPVRMTWRLDGKTLVAGTVRRMDGPSGWVYDASLLAMPRENEIKTDGDWQKRIASVSQVAAAFMDPVRAHLEAAGAKAVAWYGPGQVLVIGPKDVHAKTARLLSDLANPDAALEGDLAELRKTTAARYAERREAAETLDAALACGRVAGALDAFGWRLLASAAGGSLDVEALEALEAAWHAGPMSELLRLPEPPEASEGEAAPAPRVGPVFLALRSAWTVTEASRRLPGAEDLARLAAEVRKATAQPAAAVVSHLGEGVGADATLLVAAVYAALVHPDLAAKVAADLPAGDELDAQVAAFLPVAAVLVDAEKQPDAATLKKTVAGAMHGPDGVVLTALAARKAGAAVWDAFRTEAFYTLKKQPVPGAVVVFVNRLAGREAVLAAAK